TQHRLRDALRPGHVQRSAEPTGQRRAGERIWEVAAGGEEADVGRAGGEERGVDRRCDSEPVLAAESGDVEALRLELRHDSRAHRARAAGDEDRGDAPGSKDLDRTERYRR